MDTENAIKVVGARSEAGEARPETYRARAWRLQQHADRLNPHPKPRGFVVKARTWAEYEAWRRAQDNPRLW